MEKDLSQPKLDDSFNIYSTAFCFTVTFPSAFLSSSDSPTINKQTFTITYTVCWCLQSTDSFHTVCVVFKPVIVLISYELFQTCFSSSSLKAEVCITLSLRSTSLSMQTPWPPTSPRSWTQTNTATSSPPPSTCSHVSEIKRERER